MLSQTRATGPWSIEASTAMLARLTCGAFGSLGAAGGKGPNLVRLVWITSVLTSVLAFPG